VPSTIYDLKWGGMVEMGVQTVQLHTHFFADHHENFNLDIPI
jgi:hypothetical protein